MQQKVYSRECNKHIYKLDLRNAKSKSRKCCEIKEIYKGNICCGLNKIILRQLPFNPIL